MAESRVYRRCCTHGDYKRRPIDFCCGLKKHKKLGFMLGGRPNIWVQIDMPTATRACQLIADLGKNNFYYNLAKTAKFDRIWTLVHGGDTLQEVGSSAVKRYLMTAWNNDEYYIKTGLFTIWDWLKPIAEPHFLSPIIKENLNCLDKTPLATNIRIVHIDWKI